MRIELSEINKGNSEKTAPHPQKKESQLFFLASLASFFLSILKCLNEFIMALLLLFFVEEKEMDEASWIRGVTGFS